MNTDCPYNLPGISSNLRAAGVMGDHMKVLKSMMKTLLDVLKPKGALVPP